MSAADSSGACPVCGASNWGVRGRCKPCVARASREYYARNRELLREKLRARKRAAYAADPIADRDARRRRRYGITRERFDALFATQKGLCAICFAESAGCVDHDHSTGDIRGLLCMQCNAGLGLFRDDPRLLQKALAYLSRN